MTDLTNWKQEIEAKTGFVTWRRARKDGTKKVYVSHCAYHDKWIVLAYLCPQCKCTPPVGQIYEYPSQRTAKTFATSWLKY